MSLIPRILPLVGIAAVGVLAVNALSGAESLPDLMSGARAFASEAVKPKASDKAAIATGKAAAKSSSETELAPADPASAGSATAPAAADAATDAAAAPAAARPAAICAPTAAELAKAAGLSPAELQVMQSLGARRGQLDRRESDLSTQLALMAAAEAKVDAKLKALASVKADIKDLMGQVDAKAQAEVDRMVKVFEAMKPKDAAPRMVLLDDSVRLPIAAKMKEKSLSAVLAQMPPAEAKKLTEALAHRFAASRAMAAGADKAGAAAAANVPAPVPAPGPKVGTVSPDPAASPDPTQPVEKPKVKARTKPKAKAKAKARPKARSKPAPASVQVADPPSLPPAASKPG